MNLKKRLLGTPVLMMMIGIMPTGGNPGLTTGDIQNGSQIVVHQASGLAIAVDAQDWIQSILCASGLCPAQEGPYAPVE